MGSWKGVPECCPRGVQLPFNKPYFGPSEHPKVRGSDGFGTWLVGCSGVCFVARVLASLFGGLVVRWFGVGMQVRCPGVCFGVRVLASLIQHARLAGRSADCWSTKECCSQDSPRAARPSHACRARRAVADLGRARTTAWPRARTTCTDREARNGGRPELVLGGGTPPFFRTTQRRL